MLSTLIVSAAEFKAKKPLFNLPFSSKYDQISNMDREEIQKKVAELTKIMGQYTQDLGSLEKELYQAISDYQNALEEERLQELSQGISTMS